MPFDFKLRGINKLIIILIVVGCTHRWPLIHTLLLLMILTGLFLVFR